jgi:CBS domain-containing protein
MTTNVLMIAEDATAGDAAQLMLQHRISALPVQREAHRNC